MPLIYDAMVRGFAPSLSSTDRDAVRILAPWACRPLQEVVGDFAQRCNGDATSPITVSRRAREILDMQEQIGRKCGIVSKSDASIG